MTRYDGNTGRFVRVPDPVPTRSAPVAAQSVGEAPEGNPPPGPAALPGRGNRGSQPPEGGGSGLFDGLGKIFSKITKPSFETEDLLLVGIFYLLYRESGDIEFLLMAGAILFL